LGKSEGRGKYLFITRNGTRNLFDMLLERNRSGNLFFRISSSPIRSAPCDHWDGYRTWTYEHSWYAQL